MSTALCFLIAALVGNALGGLLYAAFAGWDGRRFVFAIVVGTLLSAVAGLILRAVAS